MVVCRQYRIVPHEGYSSRDGFKGVYFTVELLDPTMETEVWHRCTYQPKRCSILESVGHYRHESMHWNMLPSKEFETKDEARKFIRKKLHSHLQSRLSSCVSKKWSRDNQPERYP